MLLIHRFIWDSWNVAHIARHEVTPDEVEEICHGQSVTSETYKGRLRVVGLTQGGRMLTVKNREPINNKERLHNYDR